MNILDIAENKGRGSKECVDFIRAILHYYNKVDDSTELSEMTSHLLKTKLETKRYIITKHPEVLCHLDEEDIRTIFNNKGKMNEEECKEFERSPYFKEKVRLFNIIHEAEKACYDS